MWRLTGFELPFVKKGWKDILRKSWVIKWAWQWNEGVADENLLCVVFDLTINAAIFYKKCGIFSQTHGFILLKINLGFFCLQRQNTQRLWNTPSNDIDPKYHFSSGYRAASPSLIVCNFTLQNAWLIYDSIRFQNNKVTLQEVVCKKPLSMRVLMTRTKPHSTPEYGVGKNLIGSPIFLSP